IGNESKGIREALIPMIDQKIHIPSFSHFKQSGEEAESLNAAIATAIICSEFRRG
ncbi:MAG: RNA methyltransferase, partial [Bacteroidia bacterium]|nr:RNA methyltransferase [Bacteroidia bacterium]